MCVCVFLDVVKASLMCMSKRILTDQVFDGVELLLKNRSHAEWSNACSRFGRPENLHYKCGAPKGIPGLPGPRAPGPDPRPRGPWAPRPP